jgi:hypothetical protein
LSRLSVFIDNFISTADTFAADRSMPAGHDGCRPSQSIIEFCEEELARAQKNPCGGFDAALLAAKLAAHGCDGWHLLARLLAARFDPVLYSYADPFLDQLIQVDEELAFEVNGFTYCHAMVYRANLSPLRYAYLEGWKEVLTDFGYALPTGQRFGL